MGRPDRIRREEIVDFKTGDVFEDDDQEQVKAAYVRQLRLYAYMVNWTFGWWPRRGVLLPMATSSVAVELEPEECEAEAAIAVRLLDQYNEGLTRTLDPIDLANPSPENCRWCQYQLFCPAFWSTVSPEWGEELRSGVVSGKATAPPSPIHGGLALSMPLEAERGTAAPSEVISLFPLDPSVHTDLPQMQGGDRVRVTGLWRRADDSLVATTRTVIALERALPRIGIDVDDL